MARSHKAVVHADPVNVGPRDCSCQIDAKCKGARVCARSEEHTSELQSLRHLVCRLLLEKKKNLVVKGYVMPIPVLHHVEQRNRGANNIEPLLRQHTAEYSVFFFNDTATPEIYPFSLHDALPISVYESHLIMRASRSLDPEKANFLFAHHRGLTGKRHFPVTRLRDQDRKSTRLNS